MQTPEECSNCPLHMPCLPASPPGPADPSSPVLPSARAEAPCSEHAADGGCFKTRFAGFFFAFIFCQVLTLGLRSQRVPGEVRSWEKNRAAAESEAGPGGGSSVPAALQPPAVPASPAWRLSRPGAIWSSPTMVSEHTAAEITTQWYGELLIPCQ